MQTFAVSSLGNHDPGTAGAVAPTSAVLSAIGKLIGWKAWLNGWDPSTSVSYTSAGSSRWPDGTVITKPRVSGHRDFNLTTCPGDLMFGKLSSIRSTATVVVQGRPGVDDVRGRGRQRGRDVHPPGGHVVRPLRARLRPRSRDEPVRRLRCRAQRPDPRRDPGVLLPGHHPHHCGRQPHRAGQAHGAGHVLDPGRHRTQPRRHRRHPHRHALCEQRRRHAAHPLAGRARGHRPDPPVAREGRLAQREQLAGRHQAAVVQRHLAGARCGSSCPTAPSATTAASCAACGPARA